MPRSKASKSSSVVSASIPEVESPLETTSSSVSPVEETPHDVASSSQSHDEIVVEASTSTSANENADDNAKGATRPRLTIVQKIEQVIAMLNSNNVPIQKVIKQLVSIRNALDGAQIKSSKKTRKPNKYNIFMSEQMEKLKDNHDIPATEKFKRCIEEWNKTKAAQTAE